MALKDRYMYKTDDDLTVFGAIDFGNMGFNHVPYRFKTLGGGGGGGGGLGCTPWRLIISICSYLQ